MTLSMRCGQPNFQTVANFDPADVKAAFVMMVANVSRVLETDVDVLLSAVQPGKPSNSRSGDASHFVTVRHALDPFTIPTNV